MKRLRLGTTVRFMNRQGQEGLYADFLIAMVRRLGDQPTFTRQQMLVWFREGSPTLRFLVSEVDRVRLKKSGPQTTGTRRCPSCRKILRRCITMRMDTLRGHVFRPLRKRAKRA